MKTESSHSKPVVIIPCGAQKQTICCAAGEMYTGPFFKLCLAYARSLATADDIFILSAKHGLLSLRAFIRPYDIKMSRARVASLESLVFRQAESRLLLDRPLVALCGGFYLQLVNNVWNLNGEDATPLAGIGGIGKQMQWLKQNTLLSTPQNTQQQG